MTGERGTTTLVDILLQSYCTSEMLLGRPLLVSDDGETALQAAFLDRLGHHAFDIKRYGRFLRTPETDNECELRYASRDVETSFLEMHLRLNHNFGIAHGRETV